MSYVTTDVTDLLPSGSSAQWVRLLSGSQYYISRTQTDDIGTFVVHKVPNGTYTLGRSISPNGPWIIEDSAYVVASNPPSGAITQWGSGQWDVTSPQNPTVAKADAQEITDGIMSAASAVLTSASGKFKVGDVNKSCFVVGVGAAVVANPTVAIITADGGVGGTNLPTGTYTFGYTWAIRGYTGATTKGTSEATFVQTVANHKITLTVPALPANAEVTEIFVTVAPGGAFAGFVGLTNTTTFSYVTGLTGTARLPSATSSAGATLATTIASYQSATQVTLAATATLASPGTPVMWGTDDSAARDAAVAAAVLAGAGTVNFPAPIAPATGYLLKTGTTVNVPRVSFAGQNSTVFYTGGSDCFRIQMSPFGTNFQPGQLISLVVDGKYSLDGACGVHYGDANSGAFIDLTVQKFDGVGSKGIWMDNRTNWTERHVFDRVWIHLNTIGLLFDRVVGVGDPSFAHSFIFNLKISVGISQVAIQEQNGVALVNSLIHATGNSDVLGTVIKLLDTSLMGSSTGPNVYAITMEDSGPAYNTATGLNIGASAALFGTGVINMAIGNFTNVNSGPGNTNFQFGGQLNAPGIYASGGESHIAFATGARAVGNSRFVGDAIALQLQRSAGALGGLLSFADQIGTAKFRFGISAVDNSLLLDDGTTNLLTSGGTGLSVRRGRQTPTEAVLVSGVDALGGELIGVTLTAARLVGAPLNPATGMRLTFTLIQGGAGAFAVTWNAVFKKTWSDAGNATNARSTISYVYDGTNWNQDGAQAPYV